MRLNTFTALLCAAGLMACGADDDTKTGDEPSGTWETGEYTLTANKVDDKCLDGAADIVAIPDQDAGTREFTNKLSFPGSADESFTSKLALVAPFTETDVTFKKGEGNTWTWDPAPTNVGVDLGALSDGWANCTADFEFSGSWTAEEVGGVVRFVGSTAFTVTKADGDGCPELNTPPCSVTLDMIATK